uniref:Uncharacterized protein n=1 Tax=Cacopsylla melanoneura TaxID=428564 RepID=A0A8D8ZSV0_9HEMI
MVDRIFSHSASSLSLYFTFLILIIRKVLYLNIANKKRKKIGRKKKISKSQNTKDISNVDGVGTTRDFECQVRALTLGLFGACGETSRTRKNKLCYLIPNGYLRVERNCVIFFVRHSLLFFFIDTFHYDLYTTNRIVVFDFNQIICLIIIFILIFITILIK